MNRWIQEFEYLPIGLDGLTLLIAVIAAGLLVWRRPRGLYRTVYWAVAVIAALLALYALGNVLERLSITEATDYLEPMFSGLFFFAVFAYVQEALRTGLQDREQKLLAANQQLQATEQQLRAANQQLRANEQQLQAANQQLHAANQQLQAANQQLRAHEQQLQVVNRELHRTNAMFQLVLDTIPVRVFWKDRQSRYLGCNRLFARDAGLESPEQILGKDDFTLAWKDQAELYRRDDAEVMNTGHERLNYEEPQTTPSGDRIILRTSKVPLVDEAGRVIGVLGTYEDITEQKRVQEALAESEARFRAIFDNAMDGILVADIETKRFLAANTVMGQMLGYTPDELTRLSVRDVHPPDRLAEVEATFAAQVRGEYSLAREVPLLTRDGQVRYADVNASPVILDDRRYMIGLFRDVTEYRRTEAALQEHQRRLATLMANLPGMAYRCKNNPDRTMEFVSEGARPLTGHPPEALVDNAKVSYAELIVPEDREDVWNQVQAALEAQRPFQLVYRITAADGRRKWVWEQGRGVFDADGRVVAIEGFIADITERKVAESEREWLLRILKAKNEELESIIYVSSHDLRAPLVNIQGFCGELTRHIDALRRAFAGGDPAPADADLKQLLDEDIPESLRFIRSGAEKMDVLLSGLLRLCRLGRLPLEIVRVDVTALCRSVVESLKYQIEQVQADVQIADDMPACKADANQLGQVFTNLLDNAVKYRHPARRLCIQVTAWQEGPRVVYSVRDNGRGIAPSHRQKVFEVFHRLDPGNDVPGEGLGLTIVKRILDRLDGRIDVEANPAGGTVFHIDLPAA